MTFSSNGHCAFSLEGVVDVMPVVVVCASYVRGLTCSRFDLLPGLAELGGVALGRMCRISRWYHLPIDKVLKLAIMEHERRSDRNEGKFIEGWGRRGTDRSCRAD